jgi:glutathione S-transferase
VNVSGRVSNGNGFGFILAGMKLYNYCRSSASFRVRIALNLKGLPFEYIPVHLVRGEQLQDAHRARSPDALVPVLEVDGHMLSQSMAIIDYLEDTRPTPPLLPASALGRAQVRALAQTIACEIHPLNNLRVLRFLVHDLKISEDGQEPLDPPLDRSRARDRGAPTGRPSRHRPLLPRRHAHPGGPHAGATNLQRPAF